MINDKRREVQHEAFAALKEVNFKGIALLPTGLGKAYILILCLLYIKPKGKIWYIADSTRNRDVTFKDELRKWGAENWIDKIEFLCYQSAYKRSGENVELILADEIDYIGKAYAAAFKNNSYKYLVGVTATANAKKKPFLKEIAPIVYEKEIKEVEDEGILNKSHSYLVNYLLTPAENKRYLAYNKRFKILLHGSKDRIALEQLQLARKRFLSNLTSSLNICRKLLRYLYKDDNNKILIFCGLSEQADAVCKFSYHSKNNSEYLDAFDRDEIRVVAVVGKADRGLNLNGVNVIVFESPTSSSTKFKQRSGRGRRLHVDDILMMYFLVPYYVDNRGKIRPTIVNDWVHKAAHNMNFNPKIFKFNA